MKSSSYSWIASKKHIAFLASVHSLGVPSILAFAAPGYERAANYLMGFLFFFKKVWTPTARAVLLLASGVSALVSTAQAQTGTWSVRYRVNGEAQSQHRNLQTNSNQISINPWWNSQNNSNVFPNFLPLSGTYPLGGNASTYPNSSGNYGSASTRSEGTITILFDWTTTGTPPPAPPKILSFLVRASLRSEGSGQSPVTLEATTGLPGESVVATGPSPVAGNNPPWYFSSRTVTGMIPVVLQTQGQTHLEWTSPNLFAKSSISTYVPTQSVSSTSGTGAAYPQEFKQEPFTVVSPDPAGLALAPIPDPTPRPALNQYVMNGGGQGFFVIPCVVNYGGSNANWYSQLLSSLDWAIERAPSAMAPRVTNGSNSTNGNGPTNLFPRHSPFPLPTPQPAPVPTVAPTPTPVPNPSPTPIAGLAFENVLPASNSAFGRNSISHKLNNQTFATSPFALFYNATATTHPAGGPLGYDATTGWISRPTPNWLYYYHQAWKNPWHIEIKYYPGDSSRFKDGAWYSYDDPDYIWVSDDAHGLKGTSTYLFGKVRAANGTLGPLQIVGTRQLKGIDTYAAIISHECTHKLCSDYINDGGYADVDGDRVPDAWEVQAGLIVGLTDSIGWTTNPSVVGELGNAYSASQGDDEVFARMHERTINADVDRDWANDGLNYGRPLGSGTPWRGRRNVDYPESGVNADFSNVAWPSLP